MAKGTISKKTRAPSIHSRAARRATSPSIDTDKSLKNVQPPPDSIDNRPSILAIHHGAGVSKKQKKSRALSSKARKRQEKAQDRAVAILERTEKKVGQSKNQSRKIQSRSRVWDEINQSIPADVSKTVAPARSKTQEAEAADDDSEIEMGEAAEERTAAQAPVQATVNNIVKPTAELSIARDDDDDEIL